MEINMDVSSIYIIDRSPLRSKLGLLDPYDGDAFLHEASARSRYQSGEFEL